MRDKFDALLAEKAAQAGAEVRDATPVRKIEITDDGVRVYTKQEEIRAQVIVGADGAHSTVRAAMDAAGLVFAGALLLRGLLGAGGKKLWILPLTARAALSEQGDGAVERGERSLVIDAGLLAVALAAASALIDTQLAAGNLSALSDPLRVPRRESARLTRSAGRACR